MPGNSSHHDDDDDDDDDDVNTFKLSLLVVRSLVLRVYIFLSPFEVDHS